MTIALVFQLHLVLGYGVWLLICAAYVWPRLWSMDRTAAHRAIAALNSFRVFGLVFLVPGVVGGNLPASFAGPAAYGDFATGLLAILALMTVRFRLLFAVLVVAFNVVGAADIIIDYFNATVAGLPEIAGQLGAAYPIAVVYVPLLMIGHATALALGFRRGAVRP